MFLKILKMILYFFIIFAKPVYADDFDSTKDVVSNQYYNTIAFTTDGYPTIQNILYEKSDFVSENTNSVISSGIGSLTDFGYTRRIPSVADHVNAPPGTQVDIVYLYRNGTSHNVNISKIDLVLSRNDKNMGDLAQILDISRIKEGSLLYLYSGLNITKSGLYKEYPGIGEIQNSDQGGQILESVRVKNPLSIDDVKAVKNSSGDVDVEIYIQNNSNEYLNNLKFTYGSHEEIFNLPAYEEHIVKFTIQNPSDDLGTFSIYNPNTKEICAINGSAYYNYFSTDAISVFSYRGEDIVPGATVQPIQESFCIKRIPYTMISNQIVLSKTIEEGDILGISDEKILPKTGKFNWIFVILLVVDGLLWYSVYILRRNYESKNINTRICTKSSKNAR